MASAILNHEVIKTDNGRRTEDSQGIGSAWSKPFAVSILTLQ